jgi:hypothetical protein
MDAEIASGEVQKKWEPQRSILSSRRIHIASKQKAVGYVNIEVALVRSQLKLSNMLLGIGGKTTSFKVKENMTELYSAVE